MPSAGRHAWNFHCFEINKTNWERLNWKLLKAKDGKFVNRQRSLQGFISGQTTSDSEVFGTNSSLKLIYIWHWRWLHISALFMADKDQVRRGCKLDALCDPSTMRRNPRVREVKQKTQNSIQIPQFT